MTRQAGSERAPHGESGESRTPRSRPIRRRTRSRTRTTGSAAGADDRCAGVLPEDPVRAGARAGRLRCGPRQGGSLEAHRRAEGQESWAARLCRLHKPHGHHHLRRSGIPPLNGGFDHAHYMMNLSTRRGPRDDRAGGGRLTLVVGRRRSRGCPARRRCAASAPAAGAPSMRRPSPRTAPNPLRRSSAPRRRSSRTVRTAADRRRWRSRAASASARVWSAGLVRRRSPRHAVRQRLLRRPRRHRLVPRAPAPDRPDRLACGSVAVRWFRRRQERGAARPRRRLRAYRGRPCPPPARPPA